MLFGGEGSFIYLPLFFLFGCCVGSFVNVCIYRIPLSQSIIFPPSYCPICKRKIYFYDNIPILSYILLGGRCRFCRSKISLMYPVYEFLTGLVFCLVFLKLNNFALFLVFASVFVLLLIISGIDLKHNIIPDVLSFSLIGLGLLFSPFNRYFSWWLLSVFGALFSAGLFFLIYLFGRWVFKKEAMGEGDIKLSAGIGSIFGISGILYTLFFASLIGTIVSLVLIFAGKKRFGDYLPFGPFLGCGCFIYFLIK